MTLSHSDKERIRSEEIFRSEVAKSLDRRYGITRFFNSPLGLWLLSSVFLASLISGGHSLYTFLDKRSKDQQLREDLAYEISTHCGEFVGSIKKAYNYDGYSRAYDDHLKRLAQCHLSRFKDATMDQLIWELHSLPRKSDKRVADDLHHTIYNKIWPAIWELSWHSDFPRDSSVKTDFDAKLYDVLHQEIVKKVKENATQ